MGADGKSHETSDDQMKGAKTRSEIPLPFWNCPSRRAPKAYKSSGAVYPVNADKISQGAKLDYAGNCGNTVAILDKPEKWDEAMGLNVTGWKETHGTATGVIFSRSEVTFGMIRDGTSNTYMFAEKYLDIRFLEFSREKTSYYLRQAKEYGVTLNDLVLRDLFLTIDQWRKENGWERLDGWTRLAMPMNIRVAWHEKMPAANAVSFVFLDRRKRDLQDAGQLLREIHQETEWIKTHDQRYVFLLSLKACKYLLGGMRWMLTSRKCRSTCVVSNLGRVLENLPFPRNAAGNYELGSAELYQVDAAPPIRPRSLLSFSVLTYGSRLRLCLRYDEHFLSLSQVDSLLGIFGCQMGTESRAIYV